MTFEQFAPVFATLAIQLRAQDVDAGTARGYFIVLKDLEPEFVALASDRLAKGAALNDHGQAWFPKAPEWRALARKIELERTDELRARLRKLQAPLCSLCEDTGWRLVVDLPRRVASCDCRSLRRLEVLGRRPMPALPSGEGEAA